jgi:gliding motility-associated-like protein
MKIKSIILLSLAVFSASIGVAQDVTPTATFINDEGVETESQSDASGQAPLNVTFRANPVDMGELSPVYEWHFHKEGEEKEMMVRYEEDTEYTFMESGTTIVTLIVKLNDQGDQLGPYPIKVTVFESKLTFPNAFSPNGDERNQTFKPKECQSIVDFHAYIFNRWGQKLYEWTDPNADGWDGTYNGKDVKEGTYFILVKARGADGREYNIRKDVNLLRNYIQESILNN